MASLAELMQLLAMMRPMPGPQIPVLPKAQNNVTASGVQGPRPPPMSSPTDWLNSITATSSEMAKRPLLEAQVAEAQRRAELLKQLMPMISSLGGESQAGQSQSQAFGALAPQQASPITAPDVGGGMRAGGALTGDPLSLIEKYESGGRNIMQNVVPAGGGYNPSVGRVTGPSTAQGYYQITNTTWREYAPKAGVDLEKYPTAMTAPKPVQSAVAQKLFDEQGFAPWAPYNPRLAAAISSGATATPAQAPAAPMPQTAQMAVPPGAAAMNLDPTQLARLRAGLALAGISGDPLGGFAQAYYNSPQYKAAIERATKGVGLEFLPQEEAIKQQSKYLGPEADPIRQGQIASAQEAAKLGPDMLRKWYETQAQISQQRNAPVTLSPGQTLQVPTAPVPAPPFNLLPGGAAQPQTAPPLSVPAQTVLQGRNPAEVEFEQKLGQENAKQFTERRAAALDAAKSLEASSRARQLLDSGIYSGPLANAKLSFGRALAELGYGDAKDAVANTEAFVAARAEEVGRIIKQFGAGTGLSDADREYAAKMAGGQIAMTEGSIRKIMEMLDRGSRNAIEKFNKDAEKVSPGLSPYPLTVPMPNLPTGRSGTTSSGVPWSVQ